MIRREPGPSGRRLAQVCRARSAPVARSAIGSPLGRATGAVAEDRAAGAAPDVATQPLPAVVPTSDPAPQPVEAAEAGAGPAALRVGPPRPAAGWAGAVLRRWLPPAWAGARLDPGRPGAGALALVALVAALATALGVWAQRPRVEPVDVRPVVAGPVGSSASAGSVASAASPPAVPAVPSPPTAPAESTAVAGAILVVSVVGKVRSPGLVRVTEGARVADVLQAAGGALPGVDLSGLNLARRVGDGEQVAVGVPPAPDAAPEVMAGTVPDLARVPGRSGGRADAGRSAAAGAARVDLNRASAAELDALPGIGPVTAQRILEWRSRNRRFARVEQLREIDGIGERRFAQLRELVTVS